MRRLIVCVVVVCAGACGGGGSPVQPSAPPPPPQSTGWVVAGTVVDTLSGAGVSGATLTFSGHPAVTTSSSGDWELRGSGTTNARLAVTVDAPGYLSRKTGVAWTSSGRRDIRIDLIPDRAPFALPFFREFVRNAYDEPATLQPIRRWTRTPNFYVNTINPRSGQPLFPSEIELIQQVIRDTVPQLTGGQFAAGTIEVAAGARDRRADYINVNIVYEPDADYCGRAFVGANPGEITINYERCRTRACGQFPPEVIAHEVGHAMGYWHTGADGIMNPYASPHCSNVRFSADELLHARVAYARPPGNQDPDVDLDSYSAIEMSGGPSVICRLEARF